MVAPAIIAAGISAGASLLGGLLGKSSAEKQAEAQLKAQREFAQKGIQWKVADAKAAGIHPVYALGANTVSYSPVAFNDPLPQAIANAGQDIGRAIEVSNTPEGKVAGIMSALSVERMGLENDLLRGQIRAINAPGSPPGLPGMGTDSSDPIIIGGKEMTRNPNFSDAQVIQDRYGDWVEGVYGAGVVGADIIASSPPRKKGMTVNDAINRIPFKLVPTDTWGVYKLQWK